MWLLTNTDIIRSVKTGWYDKQLKYHVIQKRGIGCLMANKENVMSIKSGKLGHWRPVDYVTDNQHRQCQVSEDRVNMWMIANTENIMSLKTERLCDWWKKRKYHVIRHWTIRCLISNTENVKSQKTGWLYDWWHTQKLTWFWRYVSTFKNVKSMKN